MKAFDRCELLDCLLLNEEVLASCLLKYTSFRFHIKIPNREIWSFSPTWLRKILKTGIEFLFFWHCKVSIIIRIIFNNSTVEKKRNEEEADWNSWVFLALFFAFAFLTPSLKLKRNYSFKRFLQNNRNYSKSI